jgi:hypothetical protein
MCKSSRSKKEGGTKTDWQANVSGPTVRTHDRARNPTGMERDPMSKITVLAEGKITPSDAIVVVLVEPFDMILAATSSTFPSSSALFPQG